jgi:hypothetical protein
MAVALAGSAGTVIDLNGATHTLTGYSLDGAANLLWVAVTWQGATTISSVNWNTSEAMTSFGGEIEDSDGHKTQMFYRVSPTTGSHNVAVAFSGSTDGGTIGAQGFSGVDTSTPVRASSFASGQAAGPGGAASPASVTTGASASSGDMAVSTIGLGAVALTVGGSATQLFQVQGTLFDTNVGAASYWASTGSLAMSWTYSGSHEWAEAVAILQAAASGTTIAPGAGSTPMTGRTMTIGWSIGMPDVP